MRLRLNTPNDQPLRHFCVICTQEIGSSFSSYAGGFLLESAVALRAAAVAADKGASSLQESRDWEPADWIIFLFAFGLRFDH